MMYTEFVSLGSSVCFSFSYVWKWKESLAIYAHSLNYVEPFIFSYFFLRSAPLNNNFSRRDAI